MAIPPFATWVDTEAEVKAQCARGYKRDIVVRGPRSWQVFRAYFGTPAAQTKDANEVNKVDFRNQIPASFQHVQAPSTRYFKPILDAMLDVHVRIIEALSWDANHGGRYYGSGPTSIRAKIEQALARHKAARHELATIQGILEESYADFWPYQIPDDVVALRLQQKKAAFAALHEAARELRCAELWAAWGVVRPPPPGRKALVTGGRARNPGLPAPPPVASLLLLGSLTTLGVGSVIRHWHSPFAHQVITATGLGLLVALPFVARQVEWAPKG